MLFNSLDLKNAMAEVYRVLKDDCVAVFSEPIENSRVFNFIQNLIPVGERGKEYHRPSILQRRAWARYLETLDDRALTNRELAQAGHQFSSVKFWPYGLLVRLSRLVQKHRAKLFGHRWCSSKVRSPTAAILCEYRGGVPQMSPLDPRDEGNKDHSPCR